MFTWNKHLSCSDLSFAMLLFPLVFFVFHIPDHIITYISLFKVFWSDYMCYKCEKGRNVLIFNTVF